MLKVSAFENVFGKSRGRRLLLEAILANFPAESSSSNFELQIWSIGAACNIDDALMGIGNLIMHTHATVLKYCACLAPL